MSGKYLHGLVVDGNFIDVRDNIFSHSELRQQWTGSEQKHKRIQEWSWDYVIREFVETPIELIPIAQKWIKKNLNSHKKLIAWVNKNWEGLVNGDERERELYIWQLIDHKAKYKNKLVNSFLKAYADREKADADWEKADADWNKADADREKAYADREKAYADRNKAYADWNKTYADWNKTYADREKTYADREKADADREKADADWEKAYADWNKAYADWEKAYADREKAYKKWKTQIMKPIFMDLLKKYPNKYWGNK